MSGGATDGSAPPAHPRRALGVVDGPGERSGPDGTGEVDDRHAVSGTGASDAALLAAHVEGDPQAFSTLVERHTERLWAVALRVMSDPDDAADALQDAYVAAFRRAGTFRGDAQVTTWLHRIVVNACLDRLRRAKVRAADPLPDDLDRLGTTPRGAERDPLEDQEQRDAVADALATLNPDQRAALVLVDMQGYAVEEAAAILGCAPGTVKSRCARGRARLVPLLTHLRDPPTGPPGATGAPP